MNAISTIIQKVQVHHLKIAFALIVILKMVFLLMVIDGTVQLFLPESSDAHYYDLFARGLSPDGYSIWSYLLKDLHSHALYNRTGLIILIFTTTTLVTPFLYASLIPHAKTIKNLETYYKIYWCVAIYICVYPTLTLFALDIYRDAVMVFLMGITLMLMKTYDNKQGIVKLVWLIPLLGMYYLVYRFRVYLAVALIMALILREINVYRINKILLFILYMVGLLVIRKLGWLDFLLFYRDGFSELGGSTTEISLLVENPFHFVFNYILSVVYQFYGLHISSFSLLILFITESFVIIISTYYIYLSRFHIRKTEQYILLFAIVYTAIWTFFNDNMGTAIRLRLFDYLAIIVVAASLYMRKLNLSTITKV